MIEISLLCKPYPMQRRLVRRITCLLGALRLRRLLCESKTSLPATVRLDRCSPNDRTRLIDLVFLSVYPLLRLNKFCKHVHLHCLNIQVVIFIFPFASVFNRGVFLCQISSPQSVLRAFLKSAPSFFVIIFSLIPSALHSLSVIFPLSIFGCLRTRAVHGSHSPLTAAI